MGKYKTKGLLKGGGINDADYPVQIRKTLSGTGNKRKRKIVWTCPYYAKWAGMLNRAGRTRGYWNVEVCDEWKLFSTFKSWMEKQDWQEKELDKDILGDGTLYSPETCIFVSTRLNSFLTKSLRHRGKYKIGINFTTSTGKYAVKVNNPMTKESEYLGCFDDEDYASRMYVERKLYFAKILFELEGISHKFSKFETSFKNKLYKEEKYE